MLRCPCDKEKKMFDTCKWYRIEDIIELHSYFIITHFTLTSNGKSYAVRKDVSEMLL